MQWKRSLKENIDREETHQKRSILFDDTCNLCNGALVCKPDSYENVETVISTFQPITTVPGQLGLSTHP